MARAKQADISYLAVSLFDKVRAIKSDHPGVAKRIDALESEIRERLESIRELIAKLNKHDRELVTVLVINGLHRTADEVLIEK
jgi:CHASE3 domain sensor protein